jgi:Ser/Thr protein kinase RdoA (MazF antagonist)
MQGGAHDTDDARLRRATRLARAALEHYGLGDARLELLRNGFVQVFRVRSASRGEHVLRLYGAPQPAQEPTGPDPRLAVGAALRSPGVLRSQLAWLSALRRDASLRVPEPVPTLGGELVGDVRVEGTPWRRRSALVGWVPGRHKWEDLSEEDARKLGSFVAGMHAHAERYEPPEGSTFPRWDWHWPFGPSAPLWAEGRSFYSESEMQVFETAARLVREDLERLGDGPEVFGVVHRDPKLENLVFEGGRVGAIDFDMSGLGHYMLDVRVLHSSFKRRHPDRLRPLWEAFLEGYEGERALPEDHGRYLGTFAVMQRVAAVNRRLGLLGSGGARGILKNTVPWLKELSKRWGTLAMFWGPYPLTGLLSEELSRAAGVLAVF